MMDAVIQLRNTIYENGYGLIASSVMRDKTLPKQSKLIYAYMCSFASIKSDGSRSAFPSVSLQCGELGMSEDTYYKWRKPLEERGFITIEKQTRKGKFERNIYYIESAPIPKPIEEKEKESPKEEENPPSPKNSGTVEKEEKPSPKKSSTVKSSKEKLGTNSISSNITSSNKKIKKIVNKEIPFQDLINIINEFYADYAPSRWSKRDWKTLTNSLAIDLTDDEGVFRKAHDEYSYIKGCLDNIAHHHDMKTGKKKFEYQGTEIPLYNWMKE